MLSNLILKDSLLSKANIDSSSRLDFKSDIYLTPGSFNTHKKEITICFVCNEYILCLQ